MYVYFVYSKLYTKVKILKLFLRKTLFNWKKILVFRYHKNLKI